MNNKSCFYTIAESLSEIYTFVLIDSDRLLIIGNAEIELIVFELKWADQSDWNDSDEEEQNQMVSDVKRLRNELNSSHIDTGQHIDDQANVLFSIILCSIFLKNLSGFCIAKNMEHLSDRVKGALCNFQFLAMNQLFVVLGLIPCWIFTGKIRNPL